MHPANSVGLPCGTFSGSIAGEIWGQTLQQRWWEGDSEWNVSHERTRFISWSMIYFINMNSASPAIVLANLLRFLFVNIIHALQLSCFILLNTNRRAKQGRLGNEATIVLIVSACWISACVSCMCRDSCPGSYQNFVACSQEDSCDARYSALLHSHSESSPWVCRHSHALSQSLFLSHKHTHTSTGTTDSGIISEPSKPSVDEQIDHYLIELQMYASVITQTLMRTEYSTT